MRSVLSLLPCSVYEHSVCCLNCWGTLLGRGSGFKKSLLHLYLAGIIDPVLLVGCLQFRSSYVHAHFNNFTNDPLL